MKPDLLISIIYNVNFDNNTTFESNNKVHAWIKVCIVKLLTDTDKNNITIFGFTMERASIASGTSEA